MAFTSANKTRSLLLDPPGKEISTTYTEIQLDEMGTVIFKELLKY